MKSFKDTPTLEERKSMKPFKDKHTLEERKSNSEKIKEKYPDRIPIICEKAKTAKISDIDKSK